MRTYNFHAATLSSVLFTVCTVLITFTSPRFSISKQMRLFAEIKLRPVPEMVNSAQTSESNEIRKVIALKEVQKSISRSARIKEKT